jgi:AcrR family transcriptional regulator
MNLDSSSDDRVSLRAKFRHATREAILEAAAGILGSDSAAQARMEDIAARAGVAVGTVYNYFEDRRALVTALLETRTRVLLDALDDAAAPVRGGKRAAGASTTAGGAFEAELAGFVSAVAAHFDANRFLLNVLLEEERSRGIDAKSASRRRTVSGQVLSRAERLMEKGIRVRALRKDDPAMYAALLVGMVRGVALSALSRQLTFSTDGTASIVRVFMSGASR